MVPTLTSVLDRVTGLVDSTTAWASRNQGLVRTLFIIGGGLATIVAVGAGVITLVSGIGVAAVGLGLGIPVVLGLTGAVWAFTVALLANPVGLIVVGVVALAAGLILVWRNWDLVTKGFVAGIGFVKRNWLSLLGLVFPFALIPIATDMVSKLG